MRHALYLLACASSFIINSTLTQPVYALDYLQQFSDFKEIKFDNINPTKYTYSDHALCGEANNAASAMILPFKTYQNINSLIVEYKTEGQLKIKNTKQEASTDGDDFILRIGLMLKGSAPMIPFMAPAWIKSVRDMMLLETDRIIYHVFNAKHKVGAQWLSPYSSSITMFSNESSPTQDHWLRSEIKSKHTIAGLWIMIDSDNSHGKIKTCIRKLEIN